MKVHAAVVVCALACACSPETPKHDQLAATPANSADILGADSALRTFLAHARTGDYSAAMASYGGEWKQAAASWFEGGDTLTAAEFLREGCKGLLFCHLGVRRTIDSKIISPDTIQLMLELEERDGRRFEPPLCCGSEGGRDTLFAFNVLKLPTGFRVLSLPVYRP